MSLQLREFFYSETEHYQAAHYFLFLTNVRGHVFVACTLNLRFFVLCSMLLGVICAPNLTCVFFLLGVILSWIKVRVLKYHVCILAKKACVTCLS